MEVAVRKMERWTTNCELYQCALLMKKWKYLIILAVEFYCINKYLFFLIPSPLTLRNTWNLYFSWLWKKSIIFVRKKCECNSVLQWNRYEHAPHSCIFQNIHLLHFSGFNFCPSVIVTRIVSCEEETRMKADGMWNILSCYGLRKT